MVTLCRLFVPRVGPGNDTDWTSHGTTHPVQDTLSSIYQTYGGKALKSFCATCTGHLTPYRKQ